MGGSCTKNKKVQHRSSKSDVPVRLSGHRVTITKMNMIRIKKGNIDDEYKITDEIKNLKHSVLFKCKSRYSEKKYLARVFNINKIHSNALDCFLIEIELLRRIDHPNIVKIIDIYKNSKNIIIVMEYCKGGGLLDRIKLQKDWDEGIVAYYFKQIRSAVAYLNRNGIVHSNLNPESFVFINKNKDSPLKLIEFGSYKHFDKELPITQRVDSILYLAPEVITEVYDEKCDIWNLGALLYTMLAATHRFNGKTEKDIIESILNNKFTIENNELQNISIEAKDLLLKMLNSSPSNRLNAIEVLQHPWLVNNFENLSQNYAILNRTLIKLLKFQNETKLQKATLSIIVSQIMSTDELKALNSIFTNIDKNGDGIISKEEIIQALEKYTDYSKNTINKLIYEADFGHRQEINYTKFLAATVDWAKEMSRERLLEAFRIFDIDKNGKISAEELQVIFGGSHKNKQTFINMIQEVDKNRDGQIDFEEFFEYMCEFKKKEELFNIAFNRYIHY